MSRPLIAVYMMENDGTTSRAVMLTRSGSDADRVHLTLAMERSTLCGLPRMPNEDMVGGEPRDATCAKCLREARRLGVE